MPLSRRCIMRAMLYKASRNKVYIALLIIAALCLIHYNRTFDREYTGSKYSFSLFWVSTNDFTCIHFASPVALIQDPPLSEPTQHEIDYFAKFVNLTMAVEDNFISGELMWAGGYYLASVTLENTGNQVVPAKQWQLFGYFMRIIEVNEYPYKTGFYLSSCGLKVFHVMGSLFRFEPNGSKLKPLKPGDKMRCILKAQAFSVARTDFMPRWYVTSALNEPRIVANTDDESLSFVRNFTEEKQFKRRFDDRSRPLRPQDRYQKFYSGESEVVSKFNIVPTPLAVITNEKFEMQFNTNRWVIVKFQPFWQEIDFFSNQLGMELVQSRPIRKFIEFRKGPVAVNLTGTEKIHKDAYIIEAVAEKEYIVVKAANGQAAFYAFQTLCSIFFTPEAQESVGIPIMLPSFRIIDAPRFEYRGLHLDVARNFIGLPEVLKIMDVMAMYKMNKLHLHLSDDEGWRLEISGMPELVQVGAQRCHDPKEEQCISPLLGSGPFSNSSGSGFYSFGDYLELLESAKQRYIEIIPEFDMPGHSHAAIKSIHSKIHRARRRAMGTVDHAVIEESMDSNPRSAQHFTENVLNPCMESTYRFVKKLISDVKEMHIDVVPLKMFHFGGDEVSEGVWDDSKECKKLMERTGTKLNQYDLMKRFIRNVSRIAFDESLSVGAWEDAMLTGAGIPFPRHSFTNEEIYVYVWKRPTEPSTPHRARLFANQGYKVILAYGSYLYFDHPYEPDPEERGLYWAAKKVPTRSVWEFSPVVMFNDVNLECPKEIPQKDDCVKLLKPDNVVGMQAELWTETVRTNEQVEYMLFPRLLAVAERAWHKGAFESMPPAAASASQRSEWMKFANAVGYHELPRLDKMGIQYRVSPPGAIVSTGKARFRTEFPGSDIEFFSNVTNSWKLVAHNMSVTHPIRLRARSTDGKRVSREVILDPSVSNNSRSFLYYNQSCLCCLIFSWLYLFLYCFI